MSEFEQTVQTQASSASVLGPSGPVLDGLGDPRLRVHPWPEERTAPGQHDRYRGDWARRGFHLPEMGLAFVIGPWLYGYRHTLAVLVITLYAIALVKVVGS